MFRKVSDKTLAVAVICILLIIFAIVTINSIRIGVVSSTIKELKEHYGRPD